MKNFKKAASILLASAMVVSSFTACGSKSEGSADKGSSETSASADTFKIGGIGPVTGGAAAYGTAVKNAIQLAVDEINADGGINGKQIEYKFEDDEHNAEKSVNAYNNLKDWGMQMLVGTVTSTPCTAVVEKTHEDNMFQLTPSATAMESIQYDNAFRMCFSDPNQGLESAKYIGGNALAEKVAVIYDSSDVYSSGIYSTFAAEAENQSFEVVSAEAFTADSNTDFTVQLQKAKDAGADMVFMPIYYQQAALIMTQADKMGYKPAFFSCDGLDGLLGVENFDASLAEGAKFLSPFTPDATDDKTVKFVTDFKEKFGETPNQFAADAYDCVYVVKAAAEKAGLTPDMSVSDMCDAMKAAIQEISFDGLTGTGISWIADGEPSKAPIVIQIENGAYKII